MNYRTDSELVVFTKGMPLQYKLAGSWQDVFFTPNKVYIIKKIIENRIIVIDDDKDEHSFFIKNIYIFFKPLNTPLHKILYKL